MPATLPDAALEAEITYAAMRLATATNHIDRKAWWNTLCALHEQRSEDQVRQMERERGLTQ
jgi:hypothetical protein